MTGQAPRVVVVGESLVDRVVSGRGTTDHPGGSPMNVAYGLGRLDIPTALVTSLANDPYGALIREHLRSTGVEVLTPGPTPARTSSALATIGADGSAQYEFDVEWELDSLSGRLPSSEVLHSGSIAAVLGGGAEQIAQALRTATATRFITLDPNIRPAVVGDHSGARQRLLELVQLADLVKLSVEDADWMLGERDPVRIAALLLAAGAGLVAVTAGENGALLASSSETVEAPAHAVTVVDTIGAGDAYMSGLIAAILDLDRAAGGPGELKSADWSRAELTTVARCASIVAGLTVARRGAHPPTALELARELGRG